MKRGTKKGWIRSCFAMLLAVIMCMDCLENTVMAADSGMLAMGEDVVRILFIGNSLIDYNDVPNKVKQIFAKAGKNVEVERLINLGQPLAIHKDNAETKEKILTGDFDYVVLQDKSSGFKQSMLEEGLAAIVPWIEEAGSQLVLYMPWANESIFAKRQEIFTNAYVSEARKRNALLAPSGEAYYELYFNYGVRWYSDNIHGTDLASLVSASAIYYTISGESAPLRFTKNDAFIRGNNYDVMTVNLIQKEASRYTELYRDLNNVPDITQRPITAPKEEVNLAVKKQGYASSNERGDSTVGMRTVGNLTDGNTSSFIVLHHEDEDPWFAVDLGEAVEFNKVVLYWGADSPYEDSVRAKYAVEGSDRLEEGYEEIAAGECTQKGRQEITFNNVSYRFVRIHVTEKAGTYTSLYEMELYQSAVPEENPGEEQGMRILFIGNSLTDYNDVPNKVKQIFAKEGKNVEVEKLINLGEPLTIHKDNAQTKEKILTGDFDYVVLQDKASGFTQNMLEEGVAAIEPWIAEAGAQLVLYMPWANEDIFARGQEIFTNAYVSEGRKRNAQLAPSGEAYYNLYFNYGVRWYSDNTHGTDLASLVSASTIYYTISGKSEPITFTRNDALISSNNYDVTTVNLIQKEASQYTELYRDLNNVPDITNRPIVPSETEPAEEINLAVKKQGYASSNERGDSTIGTQTVGNLTDGNTGSYIVLHHEDEDPWFAVDLGEAVEFNKTVLYWGADSPYEDSVRAKYTVEGSDRLEEGYEEIASGECTQKGKQEIVFDNVSYRFVRIHVIEKTGTYISLYEMELYKEQRTENTENPGGSTEDPGENTENPGESTENPGANTENPGESTERPEGNTQNPEGDAKNPGENTDKKPTEDKTQLEGLAAVEKLRISKRGENSLTLKWSEVEGAKYQIIISSGKKYVGITKTSKCSYTVKGLKAGVLYKVTVQAYCPITKGYLYSKETVVTGKTMPGKVKMGSITVKGQKISLTWKKASGVSGYEVYMKRGKGKFKKVREVKKNSLQINVKSSGACCFKIRAYTKDSSGKIYGKFVKTKTVRL